MFCGLFQLILTPPYPHDLCVLLPFCRPAAINVEYSEVHPLEEAHAEGEFTRDNIFAIEEDYGGVDPIDNDCYGDKCVGLLTRVCGSSLPRLFLRRDCS